MVPSEEQEAALKAIKYWFEHEMTNVFRLGGLAGTGKSSIIPMIHDYLGLDSFNIEYVAPTNKAALIVQRRLVESDIIANARTLHKAYYQKHERHCDGCPLTLSLRNVCHGIPGYNSCGCFLDFNAAVNLDRQIKLIVCDESSMVSREIYQDVMDGIGPDVKILFVGDHGQLEPVEDNYVAMKRYGKFDLMHDPDFVLTQIQRQAEGSPIIRLAHSARKGRDIPFGAFGAGVLKIKSADELEFDFEDRNTVGITYFANVDATNRYHKGRLSVNELNHIWRMNLGLPKRPVVGDRVVCRDFIRAQAIAKGSLGVIQEIKIISNDTYYANIVLSDGRVYEGNIAAAQFENNKLIWGMQHLAKWDYGYALTCHTAQGSEFDSVVVFEPPRGFIRWLGVESYSRWLYTAITRAKQRLLIVG